MGQPLYLGEPLGFDGATPQLGDAGVVFASDATHVATLAEYSASSLYVTAASGVTLTPGRLCQLPLVRGATFDITNAAGASLNFGGASGTTVAIASGATVRIKCTDGASYAAVGGGGGSGGSGPTVNATVTANTTLTRSAWVVQPVDTSSAGSTITITAWSSPQLGDIIQLPDAGGNYSTKPVAFNGGGINVDDPYGNTAAAPSWTSGSAVGGNPGWICVATSGGTKVWRKFACC